METAQATAVGDSEMEVIDISSGYSGSSQTSRSPMTQLSNGLEGPNFASKISSVDPKVEQASNHTSNTSHFDEVNTATQKYAENTNLKPAPDQHVVVLLQDSVNPSDLDETSTLLGSDTGKLSMSKKPAIEGSIFGMSNDSSSTLDVEKVSASRRNCSEKPKIALNRGVEPLWIFLWTSQHLLPMATTAALLYLNISEMYWFDLDEQVDCGNGSLFQVWLENNFAFPYTDVLKVLLFAGKAHEYLLGLSLGAIMLHVASIKLLSSDGMPLGLLTAAYRGTEYYKTRAFWTSALSSKVFAAFLVFCVALSALLGPSSNALLQPSLRWWPVTDPFGGQSLPSYVIINNGFTMWPEAVTNNYLPSEDGCSRSDQDPNSVYCPSSGYPTIKLWATSYAATGAISNLSIPESMGGAIRALVSQEAVPFAGMNRSCSSSFTISADHSLTRLAGAFASYAKTHHVGKAAEISRYRYIIGSSKQTFQPLVAVTCALYDYQRARLSEPNVVTIPFTKTAMSNLSYGNTKFEGYATPREFWDFDRQLDTVNFTFVDLRDHANPTSLGAVFTIPYGCEIYDNQKKLIDVTQKSMIIPCSIEARWVESKMWYDPQVDAAVGVTYTDPLPLLNVTLNGKDNTAVGKRFNISNIIPIDPLWANLLNLRTASERTRPANGTIKSNSTASSTSTNHTMMEALIRTFIHRSTTAINDSYSAKTVSIQVSENDIESNNAYATNVTKLVAKMIGLQVTDGLARLTSDEPLILAMGTSSPDPNGTITTQSLDHQLVNSTNYTDTKWTNISASYFQIDIGLDRWGYGWSFQSHVTKLSGMLLVIHAVIVIIYLIYTIAIRRNWITSAWDDIGDLIALAIQSDRAPELHGTCAGVDEMSTFIQRIRVREVPAGGNHLELVVGERGEGTDDGIPVMGKRYG